MSRTSTQVLYKVPDKHMKYYHPRRYEICEGLTKGKPTGRWKLLKCGDQQWMEIEITYQGVEYVKHEMTMFGFHLWNYNKLIRHTMKRFISEIDIQITDEWMQDEVSFS